MPHPRVRAGLHPAVEPAAAPAQPREPDRAAEEPALPLQHLRQGLLETLASSWTPAKSHGGEAFRMRPLWKEVC